MYRGDKVPVTYWIVILAVMAAWATPLDGAGPPFAERRGGGALEEAQHLLYNGDYEQAAGLALATRLADGENLAASELRSTALLFQIRRVFGTPEHKSRAWALCEDCDALLSEFLDETKVARAAARARLAHDATDGS